MTVILSKAQNQRFPVAYYGEILRLSPLRRARKEVGVILSAVARRQTTSSGEFRRDSKRLKKRVFAVNISGDAVIV